MYWGLVVGAGLLMSHVHAMESAYNHSSLDTSSPVSSPIQTLVSADKKKDKDEIRKQTIGLVARILSENDFGTAQEEFFGPSQSLDTCSLETKKLFAQLLFSSPAYPFTNKHRLPLIRTTELATDTFSTIHCLRADNDRLVMRVKKSPKKFVLYSAMGLLQEMEFADIPEHLAWDNSGLRYAYSTDTGAYLQDHPYQVIQEQPKITKESLMKMLVGPITALAMHPKGYYAARAHGTTLFFISSNEKIKIDSKKAITALTFSRDGEFCASGDEEGNCVIWRDKKGFNALKSADGVGSVTALSFDDDPTARVIVGFVSGSAHVYGIESKIVHCTFQGHTAAVRKVLLQDQVGITASEDGTLAVYDVVTGMRMRVINYSPESMSCVIIPRYIQDKTEIPAQLIIARLDPLGNNTSRLVVDQYDFSMLQSLVVQAENILWPSRIIRFIAEARAAKNYGERAANAQK